MEREMTLIHDHAEIGEMDSMEMEQIKKKYPQLYFFTKGLLEDRNVEALELMVNIDYVKEVVNYVNTISLDHLKYYLAFVMIHGRVKWLGSNFMKPWFKFFGQQLYGQKEMADRSAMCAQSLVEYLPDLIGKYFYDKVFDEAREKDVLEMVERVQEALEGRISKPTWLKVNAMTQAESKLSNLLSLVGQTKTTKSYPSTLSQENYHANIQNILEHSFLEEMKLLEKPVNRKKWEVSSATTDAFYVPDQNKLVFPAAILQPPLYNGPTVHPALNYGAIGSIIGHELTHAFDKRGNIYDEVGRIKPWWDRATNKAYGDRSKCINSQYTQFQVLPKVNPFSVDETTENDFSVDEKLLHTKKKMQGLKTLTENVADNGGVALAWDAYRKFMETANPNTYGIDSKVEDKLFFLSYGQTYCSKSTNEGEKRQRRGNNAPGEWRVNGVVMNSPDFARVFKCADKTPMHPKTKCLIW